MSIGLALFISSITTLAETSKSSGNNTDLESKLASLGIQLDDASAARASRLAIIQTIDPGARVIESNAWNAVRDLRGGLAFHPGFSLSMSNGLPVIASVASGAPAQYAGLMPGDVLTGIGTNVFGRLSIAQAHRFFLSTGPATTAVTMVRDNITNTIEVSFAPWPLPAIESQEPLHNGFGYIKVNGLFPGAGEGISRAVRAWASSDRHGLLLDLRGAGGADEDSVRQIAELFVAPGQFIYAHRDHESRDLAVVKCGDAAPVAIPVMVLVDRHTTGAAEMLAAVLHATAKSALLIGEATSGEFLLREPVTFDGEQILMATRVLDTADGTRFSGKFGVTPSMVMADPELATHDYDPPVNLLDRRQRMEIESQDAALRLRVRGDGVLERAVDLLVSLKSLNKPADDVSSASP